MRQLLHSPIIEILQTRVFISRETRLLTIEQIAKQWGMSRITLYRYVHPYYRSLARIDAQTARKLEAKKDRSKCTKCKDDLKAHARCPICTILIHEKPCVHIALKQSRAVQYAH